MKKTIFALMAIAVLGLASCQKTETPDPEPTPAEAASGTYTGTMEIALGDGEPFELPDPKTNYDLSKEFYPCAYNGCNLERYIQENGGDAEKAEKRLQ